MISRRTFVGDPEQGARTATSGTPAACSGTSRRASAFGRSRNGPRRATGARHENACRLSWKLVRVRKDKAPSLLNNDSSGAPASAPTRSGPTSSSVIRRWITAPIGSAGGLSSGAGGSGCFSPAGRTWGDPRGAPGSCWDLEQERSATVPPRPRSGPRGAAGRCGGRRPGRW